MSEGVEKYLTDYQWALGAMHDRFEKLVFKIKEGQGVSEYESQFLQNHLILIHLIEMAKNLQEMR